MKTIISCSDKFSQTVTLKIYGPKVDIITYFDSTYLFVIYYDA